MCIRDSLSIFSLHVASEAVQLAFLILSPIAGAIIGLFLAPLAQSIFEDELVVVENAIEDLAPSEIAGGAVGLIVGLIIAFLIKNIAFELFTVAGRAAAYIAKMCIRDSARGLSGGGGRRRADPAR